MAAATTAASAASRSLAARIVRPNLLGRGLHSRLAGGDVGHRFEVERQVASRMETLRRILLQAVAHDALEPGRNIARGFGQLGRLFVQDRAHGVGGAVAMERALARNHLVENCAEGENVGLGYRRLAAHLLGRHVADGAHDHAGFGGDLHGHGIAGFAGVRLAHHLGQSEVENLHPVVVGDEQVLGLQVAMDDALLVGGRQSVRDLQA